MQPLRGCENYGVEEGAWYTNTYKPNPKLEQDSPET